VVGSSIRRNREIDSEGVRRARVFVDVRESALAEAGDLVIPMEEGVIAAEHIVAELGEVILDQRKGRRSPEEITLFKSQGIAVEDIAAARYIYEAVRRSGLGKEVLLGGRTHTLIARPAE
jgi:alanine dehydrogenase